MGVNRKMENWKIKVHPNAGDKATLNYRIIGTYIYTHYSKNSNIEETKIEIVEK